MRRRFSPTPALAAVALLLLAFSSNFEETQGLSLPFHGNGGEFACFAYTFQPVGDRLDVGCVHKGPRGVRPGGGGGGAGGGGGGGGEIVLLFRACGGFVCVV